MFFIYVSKVLIHSFSFITYNIIKIKYLLPNMPINTSLKYNTYYARSTWRLLQDEQGYSSYHMDHESLYLTLLEIIAAVIDEICASKFAATHTSFAFWIRWSYLQMFSKFHTQRFTLILKIKKWHTQVMAQTGFNIFITT